MRHHYWKTYEAICIYKYGSAQSPPSAALTAVGLGLVIARRSNLLVTLPSSFAAEAAAHPSLQGERNPHADNLPFLSDPPLPLHVLVLRPPPETKPVPSAVQDPFTLQHGQCRPHRSPDLLVLSAVQEGSPAL